MAVGEVKRRNSPFSPFSAKSDAEILLSPYMGGGEERSASQSQELGERFVTNVVTWQLGGESIPSVQTYRFKKECRGANSLAERDRKSHVTNKNHKPNQITKIRKV